MIMKNSRNHNKDDRETSQNVSEQTRDNAAYQEKARNQKPDAASNQRGNEDNDQKEQRTSYSYREHFGGYRGL